MHVHALTHERLAPAQRLAAELFTWEAEHQHALHAAVAPSECEPFLDERKLQRVRAWVTEDDAGVDGLVCFYDYWDDTHEVWLAWFGVAPRARGAGRGTALLDWAIETARAERKTVLRLWTTMEEEYTAALRLYARRGFRPEVQPPLPGEEWQTVVFSLSLDGSAVPAVGSNHTGTLLCGRTVTCAA